MPTIDELDVVLASADSDFIPVSQGGITRRVMRSQLLAGLQPALAVAQGALLGRTSGGVGAAEMVSVGSGLTLQSGVLSAATAFSVGSLPQSAGVSPGDMVAISQGGRDAGVSVGQLLAGIAGVPGLDMSGQLVRGLGGIARRLSDWLGDSVTVEAFGAVGDGVTDDTSAIDRAVASGQAVRFGAKTYVVNGQWTITRPALLVGVPGRTVLMRVRQVGGAWISVRGARFGAVGVVFDGGGGSVVDSWGVLVEPACTETLFENCVFRNMSGATLGCGLTIQARDGLTGSPSRHVVRGCEASGNAVHGIWVQAASGAVVDGCVAHNNGGYGICLDFNDPAFLQRVRHGSVQGCRAFGNQRGISVGNYNETNLEPPRWGNANPDAVGVVVSGNRCHDNSAYGIAVSGQGMQVTGNLLESNDCGVLMNAVASVVSGNLISGGGQFGIDAGGCSGCEIAGNLVTGFAVGINPGGSQSVRVADNSLSGNVWGITAFGMETDGHGVPFGIPSTGLSIEGNRIELKDGSGGGVLLADGPQSVVVVGNSFVGGAACSPSQALWAHTDQILVRDNVWNGQARMICNPVLAGGVNQVQVPDMLDGAMVTAATGAVGSIVGQHQASVAGQVTFVKVVSGGSDYSRASVVFQAVGGGASGSGASGTVYVRDGAVVGVAMTRGGAGYGAGATAVILGDGQGAQATAVVGLPVAEGRRLRLHCNGPVRFKRVGSVPFQDNWTGTDILVPAASMVDWVGAWGGWQAVSFPLSDYLAPGGDGSLQVRSAAGDVTVRPAGSGHVRLASDAETGGFVVAMGRGSPEGVVSAAPGSDFRNLDGGAGSTLWIKRSGTGPTGWSAVA